MKRLGLYLHIPFCPYRCHYCDFLLYTGRQEAVPRYIQTLVGDLRHFSKKLNGYRIESIFIGGGTPSILEPSRLETILSEVSNNFSVAPDAEISLESNPDTLSLEKLSAYRSAGANRLSLGVQSIHPHHLARLGRRHSAELAHEVLGIARKAGFQNINVDLIFGLPDQCVEEWKETLEAVLPWNLEHLSAYGLQIEPGTRFWKEAQRGTLSELDQDTQAAMYETLLEITRRQGFDQYEISNFAKPGRICRHNLIYWNNEEYLGIGLGAVSYIQGERFWMTRNLEKYLAGQERVIGNEKLSSSGMMGETLMLALRLQTGISAPAFKKRFGEDLRVKYRAQIEKYESLKLLSWNDDRLQLTPKGMLLSNEVLQAFV